MLYSCTMRTVLVLRHGKSDWGHTGMGDHDRPLASRGSAAAECMGRFLSAIESPPDRVLSSTAIRARSTAELARSAAGWTCPIDCLDSLYETTAEAMIDLLRQQDPATERLLLVGHQPTWSELIAVLTGGMAVRFPTAALARIDLAVDQWSGVEPRSGALRWLVTPKLLQRSGFPA